MQTEIEAKFLSVNHEEMREKLSRLGAKLEKPMRLMRRIVMDFPDKRLQKEKDAWIRLRDEGDRINLTYKQSKEGEFGTTKEIEVTVSSLENTRDIFLQLGMKQQSFQESMRETWMLGDVEVVLDEWPWLETFIEVEGPSEAKVKDAAKSLGFDWGEAVFGTVVTVYMRKYPSIKSYDDLVSISDIKFDLPIPEWFKPDEQ